MNYLRIVYNKFDQSFQFENKFSNCIDDFKSASSL